MAGLFVVYSCLYDSPYPEGRSRQYGRPRQLSLRSLGLRNSDERNILCSCHHGFDLGILFPFIRNYGGRASKCEQRVYPSLAPHRPTPADAMLAASFRFILWINPGILW